MHSSPASRHFLPLRVDNDVGNTTNMDTMLKFEVMFTYFRKMKSTMKVILRNRSPSYIIFNLCHNLTYSRWQRSEESKVKVKLSMCLTKHHAMKTYWGSGGILWPRH
jgi:hypothetical protein